MMEHLVAADVLLGEQAALPIATGGSYVNMANNVFYFASRVVDKLWQSKSICYSILAGGWLHQQLLIAIIFEGLEKKILGVFFLGWD